MVVDPRRTGATVTPAGSSGQSSEARQKRRSPAAAHYVVALLLVYVVWGSTYLGIKVAVEHIPPLLTAGIRQATAGVVLFGWLRFRGVPSPTRRQWGAAGATGVLLLTVGNGGVSWAETRVGAGLASFVTATVPLWMTLFDAVRRKTTGVSGRTLAGLAVGMGGVWLLVGVSSRGAADLAGVLALLVASAGFACGSILSQAVALPRSVLMTAATQMAAGGAALLAGSVAIGELASWNVQGVPAAAWLAVAYLIVFGSLVGFAAYAWVLRHASAAAAGSYAYVNPVVAVLLAALLLGERLSWRIAAAGALIVVAAVLLSLRHTPDKDVAARLPSRTRSAPSGRHVTAAISYRRGDIVVPVEGGKVYRLADREPVEVRPGVVMRSFWGERMLLGVFDIEPRGEVPMHTHPHEQVGCVLAGEADVTIGDRTQTMKAGDPYVIPGGVPHGVRAGRKGARVVDVFSPVREEYQH